MNIFRFAEHMLLFTIGFAIGGLEEGSVMLIGLLWAALVSALFAHLNVGEE